MSDLTVEKIIGIHDEIILRYDGAQGILSEATLHFMVFRANRTEDTFTRAAIILHAIARLWMETSGQRLSLLKIFSASQVFLLQLMTI
jgi:hypothetical protein